MFFAPKLSRHEQAVVTRLRVLRAEGERTIRSRQPFHEELRDRLVAEASRPGCSGDQQPALVGC